MTLALDFLSGRWPFGFVQLGLLRGISLYSRDVDVRWGVGDEVSGPAAELMMTVTGRTACIDALEGPGLAVLRKRLSV